MTGIEMTHIPYKGSDDAIKDVVAGHIQLLFSDPAPSIPLIRSGTVTRARRHDAGRAAESRPKSRRSTRPACRASTPPAGSWSRARPARRSRSSSGCTSGVQGHHGAAGGAGGGQPHRRRPGRERPPAGACRSSSFPRRSAGARSCSRPASPARCRRGNRHSAVIPAKAGRCATGAARHVLRAVARCWRCRRERARRRGQDYPSRTVTIVAPAAPGGLYSLFARLIAHQARAALRPAVHRREPAGRQLDRRRRCR